MSTAKNLLRQSIEMGHFVTRAYVEDLTDAQLLRAFGAGGESHRLATRPHDRQRAGDARRAGAAGAGPARGFAAAYTRETAASDDPAKFATKAQYLALMDQMKAASLAAVEATPEGELDTPGPESMREYAPTVGAVLMLLGTHWLMHAGQFVPIRRKLGKPPLF